MKIEVLGIGCGACRQLEKDVRRIVQEKALDAQVEYVDDLEQILHYRLFALPGLVIDGQVAACGYLGKPRVEQILLSYLEGKK